MSVSLAVKKIAWMENGIFFIINKVLWCVHNSLTKYNLKTSLNSSKKESMKCLYITSFQINYISLIFLTKTDVPG